MVDPNVTKNRKPIFSMNARNYAPGDNTLKPGPGTYSPERVNHFEYIYIYIYIYMFVEERNKLRFHLDKPVSWLPTHQRSLFLSSTNIYFALH